MLNSARIARKALIVAVVVAVGLPATYFTVARSEPAEIAQTSVRSSAAVAQKVGTVRKLRLALTGYSVATSGDDGHAHIPLMVTGDTGRTEIDVDLVRAARRWTVVKISTGG